MDAARVLNKKETMVGEQRELEKDLLDVRMKAFLMLLGFQSWDRVASMLQDRRAKFVLRIPRRGVVEGYSRASIDKRQEKESWPEPDMRARFPSLEGTRLWREFKRRDLEAKERRIRKTGDENDEPEESSETDLFEIANEIKQTGIEKYVSIHGGNKQPYIDADLIELHHDLNAQQARKVKKLLDQDNDVNPAGKATAQ